MAESSHRLDILHDHYKESFGYVKEREKLRDRAFLLLLVMYALLILEVGYQSNFNAALKTVSVLGAEINIGRFPLSALLSATWVFTMALALRYCQLSVSIERSYSYIHGLEDEIAPHFGNAKIYRREGHVYLDEYPLLLDATWFSYGYVFPAIVLVATVSLLIGEWTGLDSHVLHRLFDSVVAVYIMGVFFVYRVHPTIMRHIARRCE